MKNGFWVAVVGWLAACCWGGANATEVIYRYDMEVDPGWTAEGAWAWGRPQGDGGDPTSGYTGNHVYGYDLAGTYPDNMAPSSVMTRALNFDGYSQVQLSFRRWLGVESSLFDHASLSVSTNALQWTTVWTNGIVTLQDTSWQLVSYDLSAVADRKSTVYVRWTMGASDGSLSYSGWNIDDVEFSGQSVDALRVTPLEGISAVGLPGGPFTPGTPSLSLSNSGPSTVAWAASSTASWVTVAPTAGSLAGGSAAVLGVSWNASTAALGEGTYTTTVVVSNLTTGLRYVRDVRLVLGRQAQTLSWPDPVSGARLRVGQAETLVATASSGLSPTFSVVSGPATVVGTQLTATGEGVVWVRATQSGSAQYLPVNADRSFRAVRQMQAVTWSAPALGTTLSLGQAHALQATSSSGLPISFSLVSGPAVVSGTSVTPTNWGAVVMAAEQSGNATFAPDRSVRTFNRGAFSLAAAAEWPGLPRGQALGTCVSGGRAYVAQGVGGVAILNISNPSQPQLLGGILTSGDARAVRVVGSFAYVADEVGGLSILDISSPTAPVVLGTYWASDRVVGVHVAGSLAYLAEGSAGIEVVDVSDPAHPVRVGGVDTSGYAWQVEVAGSLAYVADGTAGLKVLGVGIPSAPVLFGTYDTTGSARAVRVVGSTAYVADEAAGLQVLGVADPAHPSRLGGVSTGGLVVDLEVVGNTVYLASHLSGLRVVDVSQPSSPVAIGTLSVSGEVVGIAVSSGFAYLAAGSGGFQVVEVSSSSSPVLRGTLENTGYATALKKVGNRGYLADAAAGLRILDLTVPGSPALLGTHATPAAALDVDVSGNLAYVALGSAGVHIIDVSQPAATYLVGVLSTMGTAQRVQVTNGLAYVADQLGGLQIHDVSQPAAPVWVGGFDVGSTINAVRVVGSLAFLTDPLNGLLVVDVTDPADPVQVGGYETGGFVSALQVVGRLCFLANGYGGLLILDVGDPESPVRVGSASSAGFATSVWVENNLAVVAADMGGIEVYDVNDPTRPGLLGSVSAGGEVLAVQTEGGFVYSADGARGLGVTRMVETRLGQTLSFSPVSTVTLADSPLALVATASSGLPVSFVVVRGSATISGNQLTLTGVGEVVVRAEQPGNAQYESASVERTLTVVSAAQSLVWASPPEGVPLVVGQSYSLTAGASSGLPVAFAVLSGPAEIVGEELRALSAGVVTVKAFQSGEAGWDPVSETRTYRALAVADLVSLDPAARVTPDTAKPGFVWSVFHHAGSVAYGTRWAERALNGSLVDNLGNPLPNRADPDASGAALGPATPANPSHRPLVFEIPTLMNLGRTDGDSTGWFVPDASMPGLPGTDGSRDGVAAEILTYIDLPAGLVTMGVTSGDGFRTQGGVPWDALGARTLGEWDGCRAGGESLFSFWVSEAGVYPFRTVYGGGENGGNIEWYTLGTDGTRVLLNDTVNGGLPAYRALIAPSRPPFVKTLSPSPESRLLDPPWSSVVVTLSDGELLTVDDASVDLRIDGTQVTNRVRTGSQVVLTWTPTGLRVPSEVHQASLSFRSTTGGFSRTETWTFRNLKSVVVPGTAVAQETFDTVSEGGLPAGWTASNFTVPCDVGVNLLNPRSDSYRDWLVIQTGTLSTVDAGAALAVAAGETLNGQALTLSQWRSGGVLFAAGTGRCDGDNPDRPSAGGANFGQSQFLVSRSFNLSAVSNPVLLLSSAYTQTDDGLGAVEYSVDGGTTWKPVVVFLAGSRVSLRSDGSVDGAVTFGLQRAETALWVSGGAQRGNTFADALAGGVSTETGGFVQTRSTCGGSDGNRLEVFRLPLAAKRADVRLRFASTGTAVVSGRRWMIDNLRFYDVGAPNDLTLSSAFIVENAAIGTVVGRFAAVDPDASETFSYALVPGDGGEDNGSFQLSGAQLISAAVFQRATKSELRVRLRATNSKGLWIEKAFVVTVPVPGTVIGRHVFYNQSAWDGNNASATAADDGAIATDKKPLFQGIKASFTNYTSFSRGLNGIMVDIAGLPTGTPTTADFTFKSGRTSTPSSWSTASTPAAVAVRRAAGVGGSDRVTLVWGTNAVKKLWLQVRVRATAATGLAADDVFYFGNAVAEVGNSTTDALVTVTDELRIRANPKNPLSPAPVTFPFDINRDKSVNSTDQLLARANLTSPLNALPLITPGAAGSAASLATPAGSTEVGSRGQGDERSELQAPLAAVRSGVPSLVGGTVLTPPVVLSRYPDGRLRLVVSSADADVDQLEMTSDPLGADWVPVGASADVVVERQAEATVWIVTPDPRVPFRYYRVTRRPGASAETSSIGP